MNYDRTTIPDSYDKGRHLSRESLRGWIETIADSLYKSPRAILDVGCGTGRFVEALREGFGAALVGIDPSRRMLSQATKANSTLFVAGAIVVVTHELDSAFRIADRITVLDKGNILTIGTVDEVKNSPNELIQNLLNRRFEEEEIDPDEYLARLTGNEVKD